MTLGDDPCSPLEPFGLSPGASDWQYSRSSVRVSCPQGAPVQFTLDQHNRLAMCGLESDSQGVRCQWST